MDPETTAARVAKLQAKPWNDKTFAVPPELFSVPGMLWHEEKKMLYYLALEEFSGTGVIADMGSFLGGSTICFAAALRERAITRPVLHSYDLFRADPSEKSAARRFFPDGLPKDLSTRAIFNTHLRDYLDLIIVHEGDVLEFSLLEVPIELLFIDIAKSYKVMDHLLLNFFPSLMPGQSLIVMQDYLSPQTGPWHHVVMEKLSDYCEYIFDLNAASAVFLLRRTIPREVLQQCRWLEMTKDEKLWLMDRAIEKLDTPEKKAFLIANRELLLTGKDMTWGMHYHRL